jgi:hypothetical protein
MRKLQEGNRRQQLTLDTLDFREESFGVELWRKLCPEAEQMRLSLLGYEDELGIETSNWPPPLYFCLEY